MPDTIDIAIENYIDLCSGSREEILGAIATQGFQPGCPEIDAMDPDDRFEALRRVENS